jgi:KDO2-lipid IV(A) lauroyltransferase
VTFSFAGTVGKIVFHILPKEKKKTLSHLRMAFRQEKSEKELEQIGQAVFENYGKTVCELAMIDKLIPRFEELVTRSGYEYLDKAVADKKGVIITVAHFGNWEIMGGFYAHRNYPVHAIGRKIYYEKYDRLLVETRKKLRMNFFYRDNSSKDILRVLKKGEIICLVVDQDVETVEGVFVNFFGKPAATTTLTALLHFRLGSPIVGAYIYRSDGKLRIRFEKIQFELRVVNTCID